MGCPDLGMFWAQNKLCIGEALPRGIEELAGVLQAGADMFKLVQDVEGKYVHWRSQEGKLAIVFCAIAGRAGCLTAPRPSPAYHAYACHRYTARPRRRRV